MAQGGQAVPSLGSRPHGGRRDFPIHANPLCGGGIGKEVGKKVGKGLAFYFTETMLTAL